MDADVDVDAGADADAGAGAGEDVVSRPSANRSSAAAAPTTPSATRLRFATGGGVGNDGIDVSDDAPSERSDGSVASVTCI